MWLSSDADRVSGASPVPALLATCKRHQDKGKNMAGIHTSPHVRLYPCAYEHIWVIIKIHQRLYFFNDWKIKMTYANNIFYT